KSCDFRYEFDDGISGTPIFMEDATGASYRPLSAAHRILYNARVPKWRCEESKPMLDMPVKRKDLKPGEVLCQYCTGKCCRYFAIPIEKPETWDDYDTIRWYMF